MNYQISEDEFNRLVDVRRQLDLMSDLACAIVGNQRVEIYADNLLAFTTALEEQLKAVLKTVDERWEAQRAINQGVGAMSWVDWAHSLRIASGDALHTPAGAGETISCKLAAAATVDPDWRAVADVWRQVQARTHANLAAESPTTGSAKSRQRKRDRLAA